MHRTSLISRSWVRRSVWQALETSASSLVTGVPWISCRHASFSCSEDFSVFQLPVIQ